MSTRKKEKIKISKTRIIAFVCICACLCISLIFTKPIEKALGLNQAFYKEAASENFILHFVDVGQGSSTVIEFPNNEIMVIDSGDKKNEADLKKYLEKVIYSDRDNKTIDYLIATHTDADHIGNMAFLLENYDVEMVLRPEVFAKSENNSTGAQCDTATYDKFIKLAYAETNCEVKFVEDGMDVVKTLDFIVSIFGPVRTNYTDPNDFSPFILIEYNGFKTLITGDAPASVEKEILSEHSDIIPTNVDIYVAGHHGSNTSSCVELLNHINADYAVISAGKDNKYGHPHAEVVSRFTNQNMEIMNTAEIGNIVFACDEEGNLLKINGEFKTMDAVRWWMIVVALVVISGILIFSIKIKNSKKLK